MYLGVGEKLVFRDRNGCHGNNAVVRGMELLELNGMVHGVDPLSTLLHHFCDTHGVSAMDCAIDL